MLRAGRHDPEALDDAQRQAADKGAGDAAEPAKDAARLSEEPL